MLIAEEFISPSRNKDVSKQGVWVGGWGDGGGGGGGREGLYTYMLYCSLVPRPDFILQPWSKIGRRPGIIATSQAGNGGLGYTNRYVLTKPTISGL